MIIKIYLACFSSGFGSDVIGYALGEDGQGLASHLSSNSEWSKHDMGLTSDWKRDHYMKIYPEGCELIWIDNPDLDERWQKALELNRQGKTNTEEQFKVRIEVKDGS